jgi:hypothetical protein
MHGGDGCHRIDEGLGCALWESCGCEPQVILLPEQLESDLGCVLRESGETKQMPRRVKGERMLW